MRRLWLLLLALPVAGCLGGATYRQMRREALSPAPSEYYRSEISRPAGPAVVDPGADALAEVEARLEAAARQGQAQEPAADDEGLGIPAAAQRAAAASNADPAALSAALQGAVALPTFLALVQERNPAIAAARREVRAALLRYPQATALDDVLVQYNAFTKQLDTLVTVQPQKAMTTMQFPFPDVAALKGQVVAIDVALARIDLERRRRDVLADAKVAWFGYVYLHAAIAVTQENLGLLDSLSRVTQGRYENGQALYGDAIAAQLELAMVAEEEKGLQDRLVAARAALNALLDRPAQADLGTPEAPPDSALKASLDEVLALALRQRQELQRQRVEIQRMQTMMEMATRMATPDPTAGASFLDTRAKTVSGTGATASAMGGEMGSGTFDSQPRPDVAQATQYGRENAYVRETAVRVEVMQRLQTDLENETRAMVYGRWADLSTAARRSQAFYRGSQIPLAREALQAAETAYATGKADFATYIEAQRRLLRFQLEEAEAQRDYHEALARLEQTVGSGLAVVSGQ